MSLTANQVKEYHEKGFLAVEGFFSDEQCARLKTQIQHIISQTNSKDVCGIFATGTAQLVRLSTIH